MEPIGAPDLNEVQEEQKILNNNALLRQYLYHDSLNNVVLNENKETATYHVVPGTEDKANWQKGEESLIQLDKIKSKTNKENQPSVNAGIATVPVGEEDGKKQADRFQSLVIQDDDMLTKDEGDDKEPVSSEDNGGNELGEGDENKQAAAIQSMMNQEDDMIQHQEDEEDDVYPGNNSTLEAASPSNTKNAKESNNNMTNNSSTSPEKLRGKPTSYYSSGVALNKNPNKNVSEKVNQKLFLDSTGFSSNISVKEHEFINQSFMKNHQESSNGSSSSGRLTNEQSEQNASGTKETSSTSLLSQNDITGGKLILKVSTSQSIGDKEKNNQTKVEQPETPLKGSTVAGTSSLINEHSRGKSVGLLSGQNMRTSQNGIQIANKPRIESMAAVANTQSRVPEMMKLDNAANQDDKIHPDISHSQATSMQSQHSLPSKVNLHAMTSASSGLKNQELAPESSRFSQSYRPTGPSNAMSSMDSNAIQSSTSVSNVHNVVSPVVITLPKSSSRPIKFVFHAKDMKSKEMPAVESEGASKDYQSAFVGNDVTQHMNDDGKMRYGIIAPT